MISFTLDTNCLIDVDEMRPSAVFIQSLLDAHRRGDADVALVASSASERQQSGAFLENFAEFDSRRTKLGFGELKMLPPIGRCDISFIDHGLFCDDEMFAREQLIFRTLFPTSPPEWREYAASRGADANDRTSREYLRWRNQLLDAQAFWAHDFAKRGIFVTSDLRFKVLNEAPSFPNARIMDPAQAARALSPPPGGGIAQP